ncbi:unnamed protein product [Nyctereutes procyonoides]|uniref:(raccoon dog) hypothetical protein n=1 Tax=Nyctereutes procyonoides TaxID=34880 RepID=A0A811YTJ7_NYCPR|nr:unnamed protein product [Nyctereutes procyonoides]
MMRTLPRWHSPGAREKCSHSKNWLHMHTQSSYAHPGYSVGVSTLRSHPCFTWRPPSSRGANGFKVLLSMREPHPKGKVEIFIMGRRRFQKPKAAFWPRSPRGKRCGGTNVPARVFLCTTVMSSLDEATQALETGQETVQEPVTKTQ